MNPFKHGDPWTFEDPEPGGVTASQRLAALGSVLLIGFTLVNLFTPPILSALNRHRNAYLAVLLIGVALAQIPALAFWAVLAPQRLVVRFFGALAVAALLWGVFGVGIGITDRASPHEVREWFAALLVLPVMAIAVEGPIWIMKWISGCRMIRWPRDRVAQQEAVASFLEEAAARRQFSIAQILALTAFVAVALGMTSSFAQIIGGPAAEVGAGVAILSLVLFVVSAVTVVPCIRGVLMARHPLTRVLVPTIVATIVWMALTAFFHLVLRGFGGPAYDFELFALPFLMIFPPVGIFFAILQAVRRCGYEVMWLRRAKQLASQHVDTATDDETPVDLAETPPDTESE